MDTPLQLIRKAGKAVTRYLKQMFEPESELLSAKNWATLSRRDKILVRRAYYDSDDLYKRIQTALEEKAQSKTQLLPLRNPTRQVVEFHVNHLFPGSLDDAFDLTFPVRTGVRNASPTPATNGNGNGNKPPTPPAPTQTESNTRQDQITAAIRQIHDWSNLAAKKQPAVRSFARDGEVYIKVVEHPDKDQVYWEFIDAADVVDFDEDVRGFLTWIRIDITKYRRVKGKQKKYIITEVWSKDENSLSVYEHDQDWGTDLDQLKANPTVTPLMSANSDVEGFGIDFIPIARGPFIEVFGKKEGQAAIDGAMDKVDEANRLATNLHRLLASENGAKWALRANMVDTTGRPIPAPKIDTNDNGEMNIGGNQVIRLPGMSQLDPLVADIDYTAALGVLTAHLHDMEDDLPEMAYKRLREQGELSGVALQIMLSDAIARGEEAQGNLGAVFVRANQMGLTIAQRASIPGFSQAEIGTFEAGDFDHTLAMQPIIPIPVSEQAATFNQLVQGGMPVVSAMKICKFSQDQIDEVAAEIAIAEQRKATNFAQSVMQASNDLNAQRQQQGGGTTEQGKPPAPRSQPPVPQPTP